MLIVIYFRKTLIIKNCGDFSEHDHETPRKRKLFWNAYQNLAKNKIFLPDTFKIKN